MGSAISTTAQFGELPTNRPDDLDDAYMDGGPTPLWPILQALLDRSEFTLLGVSGALVWSGDFGVRTGGSNAAFTLDIGAIQSLVLVAEAGGTYDAYFYAGGTITQTKVEGGGNLANSSWYYVYAKPGGGGICDFEITTVAPRTNRVFKTGSGTAYQSRRYLGCFKTTSAGAPIPCRAHRGRYTYLEGAPGAVSTTTATATTAGYVTYSLAALVPPHSRVATLDITPSGGSGGGTAWRAVGDAGGDTTAAKNRPITLDASQNVEWNSFAADGAVIFIVRGFDE